MSRAFTPDEMRDRFLQHIREIADYWLDESRAKTTKEKLDGAIFSILVVLDGGSGGMPGFKVLADPHPDDKQYCIDNGENWIEPDTDISNGGLHEVWYNYK